MSSPVKLPPSNEVLVPSTALSPSDQENHSSIANVAQSVIEGQPKTVEVIQKGRFHCVITSTPKDSSTIIASGSTSESLISNDVPPPPPLTRESSPLSTVTSTTGEENTGPQLVAPIARRPPTREDIVARFASTEASTQWYQDLTAAVQIVKERFSAEDDVEYREGGDSLTSLERQSPNSFLLTKALSDELVERETLEKLNIEKNSIVQRPNLSAEEIVTDEDRDNIHEQALLMQWAVAKKNREKFGMMKVRTEEKLRQTQPGPSETTQAQVELITRDVTAIDAIETAIENLGCAGRLEQLEAALIEFVTKVRSGPMA